MFAPPLTVPLLEQKAYDEPSEFTPENLLREARRQKSLGSGAVPDVCVPDPDGDLVAYLRTHRTAERHSDWACYHTRLYTTEWEGLSFGVVGQAVGASFAVLVAEQLFASGCRLLISPTSAGQITPVLPPPYGLLIEWAIRDEGTSYHYLPPGVESQFHPSLLEQLRGAFADCPVPVVTGDSWTTDAPYRETRRAIEHHRLQGILAVEMEAAALYAFASDRDRRVVCFALVTNQMAQIEGDFEKCPLPLRVGQ